MRPDPIRPREERSLHSVAQIQHLLRVEFGRARRYSYALSVLCLAIDQLGALRDELGFEAKESVVEGVVHELFGATRASDAVGRTPDDRMVVLLPHTDGAGLAVLAARVLERVRGLSIPAARGERLTLSIGASALRGELPVFQDELLREAEQSLADASARGGDQLVVAGRA